MVGDVVYLDKTSLEDAIARQQVRNYRRLLFRFWMERYEKQCHRVSLREAKDIEEGENPAQIVIKEIMNSMYGKPS